MVVKQFPLILRVDVIPPREFANRMKTAREIYISIIAVLIFFGTLSGCKESSLVPLDGSHKIDAFVGKQWVLQDDGIDLTDTCVSQRGWVIDVKADGSFSSSGPSITSSSGRWVYNPGDSSITLVSADGKNTITFILDSVGGTSAVLKKGESKETLIFKQKEDPLLTVFGNLVFEKSVTVPARTSVHVVWKMLGTSDRYLVWGNGNIDDFGNSFRLDYDSYPPDSVVQRFFGCNGKVGIGHIVVFNNNEFIPNGSVITGPLIMRIAGIVRERAIVFVFGKLSGSPCARNLPWVNWFQSGYNLGETMSIINGPGFYRPVNNGPLQLTFSDEAATLQTPVWWQ